jgi:hypothetical protein
MTFIEGVNDMEFKVRPTDPEGHTDTITLVCGERIYLTGISIENAEKLADLLLQAAMAMRLSGKE